MKSRVIAGAALVLIAVVALAVACGGDGNGDGNGDEAGIRTRQGLGGAALAARAVGVGFDRGGMVAPDFYPYPTLQESQNGITVQGFGSAAITADSAILEFYFGGKATGVEPAQRDSSEPGSSGGGS